MDEVTLYNLSTSVNSAVGEATAKANRSAIKLMILHLYWEHNLGIRKIAKRLGVPMKYVKNVVLTSNDYTVD